MLTQRFRIFATAIIASLAFQNALAADNKLTEKDKISYSIGVDLGQSFEKQNIDINSDMLIKGLNDGKNNTQSLLTKEEVYQTIIALQGKLAAQQAQALEKLAENNLQKGNAFLKENKGKPGVKTLASGLQYRVIKSGKGESPSATDIVTTNYRGQLIDGTEFDSSYKRKEPATFPVNGVIPGWTEALQLMKPGAKWELFVPADLAYGKQGIGRIGPNETLIFEVELLDVQKPQNKAKSG